MVEENPIPTVLVIDDSELIHRLLETRLQGERLVLDFAISSEGGLKKAIELNPDIVLLDIAMEQGMNGFELLMASYAMAHLKLDMLLTETGYVPTKDQRLRVFLTNSLEEPHADSGTLWGNLLSDEADQANEVKRDTPVMCIIHSPLLALSPL